MSKPKLEINQKEYFRDIYFLYESIGVMSNIEELKNFFKDILTRSELRMLKRRWHVANLLNQGLDIRTVSRKSKTSTQTVSKIKQILEGNRGGLKLAIDRVNKKTLKEKQQFISQRTSGGSKYVKKWFK
jgi:TrpR-related protein YerC/YecD